MPDCEYRENFYRVDQCSERGLCPTHLDKIRKQYLKQVKLLVNVLITQSVKLALKLLPSGKQGN